MVGCIGAFFKRGGGGGLYCYYNYLEIISKERESIKVRGELVLFLTF